MKYIILIFSFIGLSHFANSQIVIMSYEADSLVRAGSDHIYNVQFDSAHACFEQVINDYPDHPAGYFLDAMIEWWKIWINRNNETWDDEFLEKINKVIEICDVHLEKDEKDINALFFKGGALGFRGRFYVLRKEWFDAISDGKEAYDILTSCRELAPGNHDIMLGTGIYNYFAVAFPEEMPILNPLMTFLPSGDKQLGLLQLRASAKKARYAATEAEVALLQIYYQFEKNYAEALKIAVKLHERYPMNPYFHRYIGKIQVVRGKMKDVEHVWREIIRRYKAGAEGYDLFAIREALYYVGYSLYIRRDYELALQFFYKCDEACRAIDKEPSGFMVKLNIYVGKIYDRQGKRDLAIRQYEKILRMPDYQNSHNTAERYLKKPYGQ